jgi:hypothetical protein
MQAQAHQHWHNQSLTVHTSCGSHVPPVVARMVGLRARMYDTCGMQHSTARHSTAQHNVRLAHHVGGAPAAGTHPAPAMLEPQCNQSQWPAALLRFAPAVELVGAAAAWPPTRPTAAAAGLCPSHHEKGYQARPQLCCELCGPLLELECAAHLQAPSSSVSRSVSSKPTGPASAPRPPGGAGSPRRWPPSCPS